MKVHISNSEKGQSLVIIALGIIAFIALLALVLDGANAYAAKRQAQNAADSGALAGATALCDSLSESTGRIKAQEYVEKNNAAVQNLDTDLYVEYDLPNPTVEVTATVTRNTFFAGVIGISQINARASAQAKCEPISGVGVMPVAWACRDTTLENGVVLPGIGCAQKIYGVNCNDKYNGDCTYILMDSVKVADKYKNSQEECWLKPNPGPNCCNPSVEDKTDPFYCYCDPAVTDKHDPHYCAQQDLVCSAHDPNNCSKVYPNTTDCDPDDDCIDEIMAGGSRSWLDLDGGGGGASELTNWIINGYPDPIPQHKWIPEESGVATSIFHTVANYVVGINVTLPVFDTVCDKYPYIPVASENQEACTYGPTPPEDMSIAGPSWNYHIMSFAEFHITCVQTGKNKVDHETSYLHYDANGHLINNQQSAKNCNGHLQAVDRNIIDDNDKTIEGYFTKVIPGGYGGSGSLVDAGTFTVVLTK